MRRPMVVQQLYGVLFALTVAVSAASSHEAPLRTQVWLRETAAHSVKSAVLGPPDIVGVRALRGGADAMTQDMSAALVC